MDQAHHPAQQASNVHITIDPVPEETKDEAMEESLDEAARNAEKNAYTFTPGSARMQSSNTDEAKKDLLNIKP